MALFISMPLIGAIIGWLTNWLAVRLLFRPYSPVKLPGYVIQGVIPKRRAELARSIGQVVEKELISVDDLIAAAQSPETVARISAAAADSIKARIMERLPAFIPLSIKKAVSDVITDQVQSEIPAVVTGLFSRLSAVAKDTINFQSMVEDRINSFSMERIEKMVYAVSASELRHIEILGGALGFFIGLVQATILYLAAL